jgi:hypothetical protein
MDMINGHGFTPEQAAIWKRFFDAKETDAALTTIHCCENNCSERDERCANETQLLPNPTELFHYWDDNETVKLVPTERLKRI